MYREFLNREVVPVFPDWERAGRVPREIYRRLGELGIMGMAIPQEYGGGGVLDFRFGAILTEENARAAITFGSLRTHLDVVLPYFLDLCNEQQRSRWFPGLATGELFSAIAMTEPGSGSDLAGMTTSAKRDGDEYLVNGAKTFISGGYNAELIVTLVRTSTEADRRGGLSLLVVEDGTPGFTKGRLLEKIGLKTQDTIELAFNDCRVPITNRLGDEGKAFGYLGRNLARGRYLAAGDKPADGAPPPQLQDGVRPRQPALVVDLRTGGQGDREPSPLHVNKEALQKPGAGEPASPPDATES